VAVVRDCVVEPYLLRQSSRIGVLLVSAGLLFSSPAFAEPTEADRTTARALAAEGYEALERRDYKIAEDRFRRADALVHAPTIVVDRARALVGLGRLVEAFEAYQLVIREGVPANAPSSWKQAKTEAEKEVGAIERRLAWIVLRVEGPNDPRVTIDGVTLPNASLGARRAIDPGRHNVRVTADGFVSAGRSVTLSEAQEVAITLKLEKPPEVELQETPVAAQKAPPQAENKRSPVPMWVAFGVGGAGLTFGAITGGIALGMHSNLSDDCPNGRCQPATPQEEAQLESDIDTYHTLGTASGIGFGIGLAGVATGFVLLFTNKSGGEQSKANTVHVTPRVGLGNVALEGRF
jgi:hypothetical protein